MVVKFKCKEFESKIRQTVSATGKVRLESFLESVEQLRITSMEFATVRRDEKGFLLVENSLGGSMGRTNCLIDMDKFTKLKALSLDVNSNVYAHKWCRGIESMELKRNTLLHVLPILAEFTKLTRLTCDTCNKHMPNSLPESVAKQLEYLELFFLPNAEFLNGFDNLNRLVITDAEDVEMANFPVLNKLERLQITRCITSNLDFLAQMPNINYVEINGSNIDNINQVGKTPLMTALCVSHACLTSVEGLKGSSIETLSIKDNMVEDISPLAELPLVYLELLNNPITDLSPLAGQNELELLNFRRTMVTDISPILELQNLKEIMLDVELLSDVQQLKLLKAKPIINGCRFDELFKRDNI